MMEPGDRKYYVETSVWGMLPKGQPEGLRRPSIEFLRQIPQASCFVSRVVLQEIDACTERVRAAIMVVLESIQPTVLEISENTADLAQFYITSGILPAKKTKDALHVAIATTEELDVLVSWNYRHMLNVRKAEAYRGANLVRG